MTTAAKFQTGIIPPEAIAYKLAAWKNFKTPKFAEQVEALPRLPELLWLIQRESMRPGGLHRFVEDILATFPDRIGTPAMFRIKKKTDYTAADRAAVMAEIPRHYSRLEIPGADVTAAFWGNAELSGHDFSLMRPNLPFISKLDHADFYDLCHKAALNGLAQHLHAFCVRGCNPNSPYDREAAAGNKEDRPLENVWFFHDLPGALIEMLDVQAARARESLAMTAVALKAFDGLQYAWQEKALVLIEGDTRFGKTQSVRAWSDMFPGRARLVRTPCSNSDFDLLEAIAESIGLEVTLKTTTRELKTKVEFIIRHGGLMFIFDEAHFLLPARYSKLTPPMRLNWIRTRIADQGCPLVLVTTPQDFRDCVNRFTRATGHNINQFLGRALLTVRLPAELEPGDLIAVAQKHFPDLDADYLELIAAKAMQSESYLMAVESIARRARFIARRDGRAALTLADVEAAIEEILPASSAPPRPATAAAAPAPRKQPLAVKRGRAVTPTPATAPALEMPGARETVPALETVN